MNEDIISNKVRLVQSNKITKARCEFSLLERRILYCVIRDLQGSYKANKNSFFNEKGEYRDISMSIELKSLNVCSDRIDEVKKAMMRLKDRSVELEKEGLWTYVSLFNYIQFDPKYRRFRLQISQMILPEYIEIASNFTMYDFAIALHLKSVFTQRFYELCNQYRVMGYFILSVDEIRKMFCLEKKYKRTADLHKYVITKAYDELIELNKNSTCDLYFTYTPTKKRGREYIEFRFDVHTKTLDMIEEFNSTEACFMYIRNMLYKYSGNDMKYVNNILDRIRSDNELIKKVAKKITDKIREYSKKPPETIGAIIRSSLSIDFGLE